MTSGDVSCWASIFGFILAIPSLWFSILAFLEAKESAKQAKDATKASLLALEKLTSFSAVADFTAALANLTDIKTLVRSATYLPIPDKIDRLVSVLQRVRAGSGEHQNSAEAIKNAVEILRNVQGEIELANLDQKPPSNTLQILEKFSNLADSLEPLLFEFSEKLKQKLP